MKLSKIDEERSAYLLEEIYQNGWNDNPATQNLKELLQKFSLRDRIEFLKIKTKFNLGGQLARVLCGE